MGSNPSDRHHHPTVATPVGPEVLDRSHQVPVVVHFRTPWCGPCQSLSQTLERVAAAAGGAWVLVAVNLDEAPAPPEGTGVRATPVVQLFRDGHLVAGFTGALPEPAVAAWLADEGLGPPPDPSPDGGSAGWL